MKRWDAQDIKRYKTTVFSFKKISTLYLWLYLIRFLKVICDNIS